MTYFDRFLSRRSIDASSTLVKEKILFVFVFVFFSHLIVFLLVNYSCTFVQNEQLWAIKLLSVACLSLAAKMEELNIPALSEFQLEDYNFESKVIQRMELLVLNTLEWRMASTTPFAFLHHFIIKLCKESPPTKTVSSTVGIILATMRGT